MKRRMLKIKQEIDLKLLEKFGFEENEFHENYVFETRSIKGNYVFVCVSKDTRILEASVVTCCSYSLEEKFIESFCPAIFQAGFVEEVKEC